MFQPDVVTNCDRSLSSTSVSSLPSRYRHPSECKTRASTWAVKVPLRMYIIPLESEIGCIPPPPQNLGLKQLVSHEACRKTVTSNNVAWYLFVLKRCLHCFHLFQKTRHSKMDIALCQA